MLTALAHVIVTEGLVDEAFVRERCDWSEFEDWATFVALPKNSPEATAIMTGVDPKELRAAAQGLMTFLTYGAGMFVGSWLSGGVVDHYAAGPTSHNWTAIWLVPAVGAAVILLLFLVTFSDRSRTSEVRGAELAAEPISR